MRQDLGEMGDEYELRLGTLFKDMIERDVRTRNWGEMGELYHKSRQIATELQIFKLKGLLRIDKL